MTKRIGIVAFCGAVLALVLWLFCGPDVAAEAVYPVENGANWFSRHVVRRFKALFASGSALMENNRLREEVIAQQKAKGEKRAVVPLLPSSPPWRAQVCSLWL